VIDCSSGGIEGPLTLSVVPRVPDYHVPFAERIRHEADMPTVEAGLITDPRQAEGYLSECRCDLIALRLMWNLNWPVHATETLGGTDLWRSLQPRADRAPPAGAVAPPSVVCWQQPVTSLRWR
jgi:2,4-dienoyl-CoA reductase-like NADH-dependent reductase (Old Yellow Enzyme family)